MTDTFPQPNQTTVTFFDEDGYEFTLTVRNATDEGDARDRAHRAARAKIADGEWRPCGTLLIDGMDVKHNAQPPVPPRSRYATAAAWRAQAASHLQGAIAELERAARLMPVSRERVLIDRALRGTAQTFRECTRNLEAARRHLDDTDSPPLANVIGTPR